MSFLAFSSGKGVANRQSHVPPVAGPQFRVQSAGVTLPHYPFQPLPPPKDPAPYRYDLSRFLSPLQLPVALRVKTLECNTVNAFYDPSEWTLKLCNWRIKKAKKEGTFFGIVGGDDL